MLRRVAQLGNLGDVFVSGKCRLEGTVGSAGHLVEEATVHGALLRFGRLVGLIFSRKNKSVLFHSFLLRALLCHDVNLFGCALICSLLGHKKFESLWDVFRPCICQVVLFRFL